MAAHPFDLSGKLAVVTGASRGIGRGIALELARAGAAVVITGRTTERGQHPLPGTLPDTERTIREAGGDVLALAVDHRDDEAVARLFAAVDERWGRLDVLVNNATLVPDVSLLFSDTPFWEVPVTRWDGLFAVGVRSAFVAAQHAARRMVPAGRGLLVQISSAGARAHAGIVPYDVGKSALDRITVETARELRPHGVASISLWPPPSRTEGMLADAGENDDPRQWSPVEFTGSVVAALAADPRLAMRHTGTALRVRDLAHECGIPDPAAPYLPQS